MQGGDKQWQKFEEVKDGVISQRGAKNEAYAQYFVGQSYLNL